MNTPAAHSLTQKKVKPQNPQPMAGNHMVAESKSLWNYSLSPGWTKEEVEILKLALMKFGIGKWNQI